MSQAPLALWRRVIFVDWHGVLSQDPFWMSILQSDRHRLKPQLQARLGDVFSKPISHQWMKGYVSSTDIIEKMGLDLPKGYNATYLRRRLDDDLLKMKVNVDLFRVLRRARTDALVVIATDNMDCFKEAFERVFESRRRSTENVGTELMRDWVKSCDAIICSSDVQALKAEDPQAFFGPFLHQHGLTFSDAALIDDRLDNCEAFAAQGGKPLRYKMWSNPISDVEEGLAAWLSWMQATPWVAHGESALVG